MKLQDAISFCRTRYKIILRNLSHAPLFTYDRNSHGGRILLFVREDIPQPKKINTIPLKDFEGIFVELNLRKKIMLFLL